MPSAVRHVVAIGAALIVWGCVIVASAQRVHVVRPGDTLTRIARRYRVSVDALSRENRIRGERVRAGQQLRIPTREGWTRNRGRRYRVRAGDTVARIARRYHISVEDLREANGLRGDSIREGRSLLVPHPGQSGAALRAELREGNAPRAENPPVEPATATEASARATELGLGSQQMAQRILRQGADREWVAAAGTVDGLEGTLLLPVEGGNYLRGWGSGRGGYHLAVDIGAPIGRTVRAAERGIVGYAGVGIRGYGNFVMIIHANGWVTAYAHNRVNRVVPGQVVARGDPIAEVGQTGFARGPHVHFMLVYEHEHCDPSPLFRPRILRADGAEPDGPTVAWDGESRPSGVRCLSRQARPHPAYGPNGRRRRRR